MYCNIRQCHRNRSINLLNRGIYANHEIKHFGNYRLSKNAFDLIDQGFEGKQIITEKPRYKNFEGTGFYNGVFL